jgi:hypothetical protein
MRLPHDGAKYRTIYQYGYFLDIAGFTVLHAGDCAVMETGALSELVGGRHVDLALLNFPWIVLSGPRAFVRDRLAPSHTAAFHVPFEEDDSEGYRKAAFRAAERLRPMDVRVLSEPLQEIVFD